MGNSEPQDATTSNTPKDESGDGPVTLEDRIEPGGEGSPGSNQAAEAEPPSPSGTRSELLAVPDLGEMNVGGADPQAPRHPDALLSQTSSTGRAPGPEQPLQESTGTAHRAPGQQGSTPDGESVTSDTSAGAARMAPQAPDSTAGQSPGQGDDATVPSSGTAPTPGTSEEHRIVSGIKLPQDDGA
jgi:hypothetical protein